MRSETAVVAPLRCFAVVEERLMEPAMPPSSGVKVFASPMAVSSRVALPRCPERFSTTFALISTSREATTAMEPAAMTIAGSASPKPGRCVTAMIPASSEPSGTRNGMCPRVSPR